MAKRHSALKQYNRKLSGLRGLLSIQNRYYHAQARAELDRTKAEKLAADVRIANMREQYVANQVVLKDMEIDALRHKLEQLGVEGYVKPFNPDGPA